MSKFNQPLASETIKEVIFRIANALNIIIDDKTKDLISNNYDADKLFEVQLLLVKCYKQEENFDFYLEVKKIIK